MVASASGLEEVRYGPDLLFSRLFFTVRDMSWASPTVSTVWEVSNRDTQGRPGLDFSATVEGLPLELTGCLQLGPARLRVDYQLSVWGPVQLARTGPAVLHPLEFSGVEMVASSEDGDHRVAAGPGIAPWPLASGYRGLAFRARHCGVTLEFAGALFEMEDQRNWADATLKSYCPPLSAPRPLSLPAPSRHNYSVTVELSLPGSRRAGPGRRPAELCLEPCAPPTGGRLPTLGLTHPGGRPGPGTAEALAAAGAGFVHLLVDLGDDDWAGDLARQLEGFSMLPGKAQVTAECPPDRRGALRRLADIAAARAGTVFLFEPGSSLTSPDLAEAGREAFAGTGLRVGGGSRGHFAELNRHPALPDAVEVVCVPLSSAAHDDDVLALVSSTGAFAAVLAGAQKVAGDRALYAGPVGFLPVYDPWADPGEQTGARQMWDRGHHRQKSVFAAAWMAAAVAALVAGPAAEACLFGTTGGRGVLVEGPDGARATPALTALALLAPLAGRPVHPQVAGPRLVGLTADGASVVAVMGRQPPRLRAPGPVVVYAAGPGGELVTTEARPGELVASPSIVLAGESMRLSG
jgi:D-apionolactonase